MMVKVKDIAVERIANNMTSSELIHPGEMIKDEIMARGLTQKELAERTGIAQGDISKLENGNANPSIRTLQRLANGMGMTLKVEFIPRKAVNG